MTVQTETSPEDVSVAEENPPLQIPLQVLVRENWTMAFNWADSLSDEELLLSLKRAEENGIEQLIKLFSSIVHTKRLMFSTSPQILLDIYRDRGFPTEIRGEAIRFLQLPSGRSPDSFLGLSDRDQEVRRFVQGLDVVELFKMETDEEVRYRILWSWNSEYPAPEVLTSQALLSLIREEICLDIRRKLISCLERRFDVPISVLVAIREKQISDMNETDSSNGTDSSIPHSIQRFREVIDSFIVLRVENIPNEELVPRFKNEPNSEIRVMIFKRIANLFRDIPPEEILALCSEERDVEARKQMLGAIGDRMYLSFSWVVSFYQKEPDEQIRKELVSILAIDRFRGSFSCITAILLYRRESCSEIRQILAPLLGEHLSRIEEEGLMALYQSQLAKDSDVLIEAADIISAKEEAAISSEIDEMICSEMARRCKDALESGRDIEVVHSL